MERHGEPVRLVANPLNQQQRRALLGERNRILAIAREEQFLFLRDADSDQAAEPKLLERRIRGRELPLAAVDEDQIRKWAAVFEQLAVPAQDDFVHCREVVIQCAWGPTPTRCRCAARRLAARGGRRRWRL